MQDRDMPQRLRAAAGNLADDGSLSDALGIAALAAERRLGVWRAALADVDELGGGIRNLREIADGVLDPTSSDADNAPLSADRAAALSWLTDADRKSVV